ncbi:NAD(P)-dependent alcohol dehydrogenase [Amycolatopsis pithecellobii]|uniref:alcohol dehydrogenase (NADP(+)) n=1 Tax=Amycolatopsis pithecellobii TaxID=664692 RepID=A0A6N7YZZ5_9PSEU|nr:NAD(P)-dependent alcohol dehydrogenase [Amycolatopsis pithecellobii]MTD57568.1 alcohol dehydrogenase catalytic domain-containing protein [Amycolatopsis pithecellobii]
MQVEAFAAMKAGGPLESYRYDSGPLGAEEVDVRVTHCGICHTDVDIIDDHHGIGRFPAVAGHEAIGVVEAVGDGVDTARIKVGDRVGVGAIAGSCMRCTTCIAGRTQFCAHRDDTVLRGVGGGFARYVRASQWRHVQPIPDAIPSAEAAPLLCAGATVFAPILRYGVRPTDQVAVVGLGGLGHLAVQFLAKWGCEVTVISRSRNKEQDAYSLGATDFVASGTPGELEAAAGRFDFVLSTVTADLPWGDYLDTLRPGGTLCFVGVPPSSITVSAMNLLPNAKTIGSGIPGGIEDTRQMLAFAGRHDIRSQVQTYSLPDLDKALDSVREGSARYRAVLEL